MVASDDTMVGLVGFLPGGSEHRDLALGGSTRRRSGERVTAGREPSNRELLNAIEQLSVQMEKLAERLSARMEELATSVNRGARRWRS